MREEKDMRTRRTHNLVAYAFLTHDDKIITPRSQLDIS